MDWANLRATRRREGVRAAARGCVRTAALAAGVVLAALAAAALLAVALALGGGAGGGARRGGGALGGGDLSEILAEDTRIVAGRLTTLGRRLWNQQAEQACVREQWWKQV